MKAPSPILACWLLFVGLLLAGTANAQSTRIELIQLQGRTAEELIPLLRPLVEPGGALSGSGYRLIVRATEAQHAEVRRLLAELDQAPKRLLITVHMGELSQAERRQYELQVDKRASDISLGIGLPPVSGQGAYLGQQDSSGSMTYRQDHSRSVGDSIDRQQVRATEGYPSYIATGLDYPYPSHIEHWHGQAGVTGYQFRPVRTGFYALVRIRGDQAVVEISPQKESLNGRYPGAVDTQQISTTVSGPLGSWMRIGETGSSGHQRQREIGGSVSTQEVVVAPVWMRIEVLP